MNSTAKSIVYGFVIGIIAYIVIGFIHDQTFVPPTSPAALGTLAVIIIAVIVGALLSASSAPGSSATTSAAGSTSSGSNEDFSDDIEEGTVKWFNVKKGYGFITRDLGDDVFVHYRNIEGTGRKAIAEGERVSFIVVNGEKGLQAEEVQTI